MNGRVYSAGQIHVPFFAIIGDQQDILRPNGDVVATVPVHCIDAVLAELNGLLEQIED